MDTRKVCFLQQEKIVILILLEVRAVLENLKNLRNEKRVSQKKMAEIMGVSQQTISNYENREIEPDIELLSRMADYFETSIDYLVGRTEIRGKTEDLEIFEISNDEVGMIKQYRSLSEKERKCIDLILQTLSEK